MNSADGTIHFKSRVFLQKTLFIYVFACANVF